MAIPCAPALRLRLIAVAQEMAAPDVLIRGARLWNAFTGEIAPGDVAICEDRIARIGPWSGPSSERTTVIEAEGRIAVPGYIEPHTHFPPFTNPLSLGEAAACRGTTCLVYDDLFIRLALGPERMRELAAALSAAALSHLFWVARIASQSRFAEEDAFFSNEVVGRLLAGPEFLGTAEMTRWADLLDPVRAPRLLNILEETRRRGKINDGHLAGASSRRLAALAATGIRSCHEAVTADEALDRLRQGLWVLLRNSSLREDLPDLLAAVKISAFHDRFAYTTDNAAETHLDAVGFTDHLIRLALDAKVAPGIAYRMATLNPATYLRLEEDLGSVAPGRVADINLLPGLEQPTPDLVVCRGRLVARMGSLMVAAPSEDFPWRQAYRGSAPDIPQWNADMFILPSGAANPFPSGRLSNAAITRETPIRLAPMGAGLWPAEEDALVLAATDRQGRWITRGVIQNFAPGLAALATTYTTSAGIVVLGKTPSAMAAALARLHRLGGGVTVASTADEWWEFSLPMAGVHRDRGFADGVRTAREFHQALRACGYPHADPKTTLLFLTCDVLPEVRATEAGWTRVKTEEVLLPAERMNHR